MSLPVFRLGPSYFLAALRDRAEFCLHQFRLTGYGYRNRTLGARVRRAKVFLRLVNWTYDVPTKINREKWWSKHRSFPR